MLPGFESKRRRRRRPRLQGTFQAVFVLVMFTVLMIACLWQGDLSALEGGPSRHLLQADPTIETESSYLEPEVLLSNVTEEEPLFPRDLFTKTQLAQGAVILHCVGMMYIFLALAIVCDEFFVPSLDVIKDKWDISEDVAGATFMAAGGSAPELFTSIIGVFISFDDVGIGTIVGSAVFNILFVIAMCVLFSKTVLELTWWPIFRDCTFYSVALLMLVVFFMDNEVHWYEALMMFGIYILYCSFMKVNESVERFVKKVFSKNKVTRVCSTDQLVPIAVGSTPTQGTTETHPVAPAVPASRGRRPSIPVLHSGTKFRQGLLQLMIHTIDPLHDGKVDEKATQLHAIASLKVLLDATKPQNGRVETYRSGGLTSSDGRPDALSHVSGRSSQTTEVTHVDSGMSQGAAQTNGDIADTNSIANNTDIMEEEELKPVDLRWPSTNKKRLIYLVIAPIIFPLWITLPDTRTPRGKRFFFVTFLGSILWIAVFSYFMVWWGTVVGGTLSIPNEVMGLTVLAAGTSVPDLITSVIVARKGFGDMAVSSSIGSNIFDVCCGLPIPWLFFVLTQLIKNFYTGKENPWHVEPIKVASKGMACSIMLLFAMLMFVLISIMCSGWRMNKGLGASMFVLYLVFVAISLSFEYKKLTCPI